MVITVECCHAVTFLCLRFAASLFCSQYIFMRPFLALPFKFIRPISAYHALFVRLLSGCKGGILVIFRPLLVIPHIKIGNVCFLL